MFWKVIGAIIVVWLVLTVVVSIIKGVIWLAVAGIVVFLGVSAYGAIKGGRGQSSLR
jgi:hypothetical protein